MGALYLSLFAFVNPTNGLQLEKLVYRLVSWKARQTSAYGQNSHQLAIVFVFLSLGRRGHIVPLPPPPITLKALI